MKRLAVFLFVIGLICCLFILTKGIKGLLRSESQLTRTSNHHTIRKMPEENQYIAGGMIL